MPKPPLKAKLSAIVDITPTVKELVFKPIEPTRFSFKAGQFVMLHIPQGEKVAQRAYSVSSPESQTNEYRLVIKHYDLGLASNWVRTLKGGEEIPYTGPFGKFLFKEPPSEQVVFGCTSTGLAPFYAMLTGPCLKHPDVSYKIFMGVWNQEEIFYEKELAALKKQLPKLEVHYVLDKPHGDWKGKTGYITEHIGQLDLKQSTDVYLCGNPAMIKSVKEMLASHSFPASSIYQESYG